MNSPLFDRSTHKGEYRGVSPTGRKTTVGAVDIWRIADGKIVEAWVSKGLFTVRLIDSQCSKAANTTLRR